MRFKHKAYKFSYVAITVAKSQALIYETLPVLIEIYLDEYFKV